jgi:hypothetical protein
MRVLDCGKTLVARGGLTNLKTEGFFRDGDR